MYEASLEKIETFGQGVEAYRIVGENEATAPSNGPEAEYVIPRTENAKRLGDQLREQFVERGSGKILTYD